MTQDLAQRRTVLVTGGAGYIGSNACKALHRAGYTPVACDNLVYGHHLGTGRGWSVREVIAAVAAVAGRPVPVREAPRRAGDPPVLVADPARAMARLGWRPVYAGLEEMVATAWRWHARRG